MSVSIIFADTIPREVADEHRHTGQGYLRKCPGQRRLLHLPGMRLRRAP